MRLVKVSAPQGKGADIARIAFEQGIADVSIQQAEQHKPGAKPTPRELVDVKVSTPEAKAFIDAVVEAPFFDRAEYAIDVREPRSILKRTSTRELTRPVPAPMLDIDQELWQFTHVTYSFVMRVFISALLLSYGMIEDNVLLMIGGLVFLPFMPIVLAFAFGALSRQWQLVGHAGFAFVTSTALIVAAGAAVAAFAEPPIMFDRFPPLAAGAVLSAVVGIAAALGTADDVGHRQLIGLAAASQLALIPAWLGVSLVFGFSESPEEKIGSFGLNTVLLAAGCAAVYLSLAWSGELSHTTARRKEYDV
jgi:hypothetical protein